MLSGIDEDLVPRTTFADGGVEQGFFYELRAYAGEGQYFHTSSPVVVCPLWHTVARLCGGGGQR